MFNRKTTNSGNSNYDFKYKVESISYPKPSSKLEIETFFNN
jgi:hypothetical protein